MASATETVKGAVDTSHEESKKKTALYETVIKEIYHYISLHRLSPGDKLPSETELSAMLGVSRNTIREATRILQSIGIVHSSQRTGMTIREFSISSLNRFFPHCVQIINTTMQKIYEARLWFESSIIDEIIGNATPQDIDNMRVAMKPMIAACLEGDGALFLSADIDFHKEYFQCTHNDIITGMGDIILSYAQLASAEQQLLTPSTITSMILTVEEHKKIIQFVEEKNKADLLKIVHKVHTTTKAGVLDPPAEPAFTPVLAGRPQAHRG